METLLTLTYYAMNLFILGGFLWLGHASQHRKPVTMGELIERSLSDSKRHKAEALKEVWQLSDADITAPVELFK